MRFNLPKEQKDPRQQWFYNLKREKCNKHKNCQIGKKKKKTVRMLGKKKNLMLDWQAVVALRGGERLKDTVRREIERQREIDSCKLERKWGRRVCVQG